MEIICSSCEKKINIPEDKIPAGKSFSLRCPACKAKVNVDVSPEEKEADIQASAWQQDPDAPEEEEYDASEKPFDFLEEEGLTAMVCENDPASIKKIREVLDIMEYSVTVPASVRDALRKMKYHVYDLILVNETFDGSSPNSNGILIYLERLNMSVRRTIFVGLISKKYNTRDNMAAFLKSVNLTINEKDVPHIDRLLKNAINDNDLFFTVFKESMKKLGKI
ncbi:MAG: zinc-ribbon domain-containing protein [Desulfosalsimonadaceae bacterium]